MTASPQNQAYFSSCNVEGYNTKSKTEITYPNMRSSISPVPHWPEISIPSRPGSFDLFSPISNSAISGSEKSDSDFQAETTAKEPQLFKQSDLSDLVRELGLPKDVPEILEYGLCEKKNGRPRDVVLLVQTSRRGNRSLFFSRMPSRILQQLSQVGAQAWTLRNDPSAWRLFINASKRSLRSVLLHNGKVFWFSSRHSLSAP
jgi:hypothetical protein